MWCKIICIDAIINIIYKRFTNKVLLNLVSKVDFSVMATTGHTEVHWPQIIQRLRSSFQQFQILLKYLLFIKIKIASVGHENTHNKHVIHRASAYIDSANTCDLRVIVVLLTCHILFTTSPII